MIHMSNRPLYQKVSSAILENIRKGVYTGTLPSEDLLSKQLNVSKNTIREALADLNLQGIICKRHGVGNVIMRSSVELECRIDLEYDFVAMLQSLGHTVTQAHTPVEELDLVGEPCPDGTYSGYQECIYADGLAACYSKIFIPKENLIAPIDQEQVISNFLELIYQCTGKSIEHSTIHLLAKSADQALANRFDLPCGAPVMAWHEIYYSQKDTPVFYTDIYFNPKSFPITMVRKGFSGNELVTPYQCVCQAEI